MEAYRSHKNRYLALVALALLFAAVFVTVSTASESNAAGTVTLAPGEGGMTLNGNPSSNYYTGTSQDYYGIINYFTVPSDDTPEDLTSFTIKKSDTEVYVYHKEGYSFKGWMYQNTTYQGGSRIWFLEEGTITAQWEVNNVTFNPNGGTASGGNY
ncbi:MAG: hypothetical protein J5897_02685, partial [Candidatus Methanomethylophilus sp.]|nr:hypothetical protein [Methanomethylophilus sp.]